MMPDINSVIESFVSHSRQILGENLVGVYLHGSAVMGCFNSAKSDLDFIVVIAHPMTDETKRACMDMVLALNTDGPAKGIEMSIVLREVCNPFVYPTPFELHFSERHIKWYNENPADYVQKMNGTDKDLAAHFKVIRARGKCLWGAPVSDVFAEVSATDYMDSLWEDICDAPQEIENNTMYLVLNLARVMAYKKEGLILSKKEGGEWALKNFPEEFAPVVRTALEEYAEASEKTVSKERTNVPAGLHYDMVLARKYAEFLLKNI
jgi:streptomycin 3"-adenylyltransferase